MLRTHLFFAEEDENRYYGEDGENRYYAAISHLQSRADLFRIEIAKQWRKKLIGRRTRAEEELHKDPVNWNLKNSRNRSSHEGSVKESSFEVFDVLRRMAREMVSNSYYAQDEKIIRASINPISDFQDQADPSKELIGRPTSLEIHVSRSWSDTVSKILAHYNGRPDQDPKPYNMFGTTALRSQPQWGDNGGEKHVL